MASGPAPVVGRADAGASVSRLNTVDELSRPLLVKPMFVSGAKAMPCTPFVPGMSPTTLPLSGSTTMTCEPRLMNRRWCLESNAR